MPGRSALKTTIPWILCAGLAFGAVSLALVDQAAGREEIEAVETVLPTIIPEGWWKGNTHTHSYLSDGNSPPEEVAVRYLELGYDFLVLTDHGTVSDFAQYSTPDFLCIDGEEITHSTNHVNGIGLTSVISASSSIQANVDAVLAQGGLPHLNHPIWSSMTAGDILPAETLEHMEIYNALTDDDDEAVWDDLLSAGKLIYGLATDDCHSLYSQSGYGWIVVRSDVLTLEAILAAMAAGDFYASNGVVLNDTITGPGRLIVDSQNGVRIEFIGLYGRVLEVVEAAYGEYVFDGTEGYVRARVESDLGQYAWTQPLFVGEGPRDPYADDVVDHAGISAGVPSNLTGPPYEGKTPSSWSDYSARIDAGGYIVLDMGEGEEVVDVEGPDLYIEEVDAEDGLGVADPYHVYASPDAVDWVYVGEGRGDSYLDLGGGLASARYIKIEVTELDAEIDGLEANFVDPYADQVVEYSGMSIGYPRYVVGSPSSGPIPSPWEDYSVRIEVGGCLTLDLGPGEEALNGSGTDIFVEEVDSEDLTGSDDPYVLSGSADGVTWLEIGQGAGDEHFDLEGVMYKARYLRIEPVDTHIEIDGVWVNLDPPPSCFLSVVK